jgi:hypothetical protein
MFNGFLTPMGGNTSKALVNVFLHELKGRRGKKLKTGANHKFVLRRGFVRGGFFPQTRLRT